MRLLSCWVLLVCLVAPSYATSAYLLAPELSKNDMAKVLVTLEVGGDLIVTEDSQTKSLPLTVKGELRYVEQIVAWAAKHDKVTRSLRKYETATAKIQVDDAGLERQLPAEQCQIIADLRDNQATIAGANTVLTRDEYDLVNVVGNSLVINRLLPGRELADGESWEHQVETMQALLGMDHVAVCEVSSVVVGNENRQVQIRLAGTVHGTIDGAPTEMQLRGAYLFHQDRKRITKMNLAIKEKRTPNRVVPGLDVVAKVSVTVLPEKTGADKELLLGFSTESRDLATPLVDTLRYESAQAGYHFLYNRLWYVTAEQSDLVSFRSLHDGNSTAHCNITTLPARSAGRETSLAVFERDVRQTLGDSLETLKASTEWDSPQGYHCLGVVARGKVKEMPIEWRYYLIATPDKPRVSLVVTIDQTQLKQFNDADRQLIDSLELLDKPKTAARLTSQAAR